MTAVRRPVSRRRRKQSGHVMIEMGLSMIFFFFMIFGIVEYSRLMYAYNFVSYAAQEGARYASVHGSASTNPVSTSSSTSNAVTTFVQGLSVGLNTSSMTVTTSWAGGSNAPGSTVTVQVSYVEVPVLTAVLPGSMTVNSSSTMMILQ
jgi:Flp pilus assembly protein TadG